MIIDPRIEFWRWGLNFGRSFRQRISDPKAEGVRQDVETLTREGLLIRSASELLNETESGYLKAITQKVNVKLQEPEIQNCLKKQHSGNERKEYCRQLATEPFEFDSPFLQLALSPSILNRVNRYLGMWSYLRSIEVWLNFPSQGEAKETQLWHRDSDDVLNMKVFIYLNDVTEENGPFCFIPETHPLGKRHRLIPRNLSVRVTDDEMKSLFPEKEWTRCTGSAGTVIFSDTTGFHKGLKPLNGERIALMFQYISGKSRYPRTFSLKGKQGKLTKVQQCALICPEKKEGGDLAN